jgi:hypothetical protein
MNNKRKMKKKKETLSKSFYEASITPIPKLNKDTTNKKRMIIQPL